MYITPKLSVNKLSTFTHPDFVLQPAVDMSGKVAQKSPYFISLNRVIHNPHYIVRRPIVFNFSYYEHVM